MSHTPRYNTEEILALLKIEPLSEDRFRGQSHFMGSPNVFGGQALGQALYAAASTVPNTAPERRVHSLHSLFLQPGDYHLPIDYEVERVRDGGSFSTRRVVAFQEGKRIFVMSASFQSEEQGLDHQQPAPPSTDPESLPSTHVWLDLPQEAKALMGPAPVDFRIEHADETNKRVWIRSPITLTDDKLAHESLFAYVSDYGLLVTSLQKHHVSLADRRLQVASLDHSIWFHRPFRMDEWLLIAMESPNASGGRGLALAHVYNRQGVLVATLAQEGLIRLRQSR